jgi:hypothetical protein
MQDTDNAFKGGISSYTYKLLEMHLQGALPVTHTRYWKAPVGGFSSYTYKLLDVPV